MIALFGAISAIIGSYYTSKKTTEKAVDNKAVELEHRITALETNQRHILDNMFNKNDRECLQSLKVQMGFLLDFYVKEAAAALKNPPSLDVLLTNIELNGMPTLESLDPVKKQELVSYLKKTINDKSKGRKQEKARMLLGIINTLDRTPQPSCEV